MTDTLNNTYTILVTSKTKVVPIKRVEHSPFGALWCLFTNGSSTPHEGIPAYPLQCDLWLDRQHHCPPLVRRNPRDFKTYVGNRVSHTVGLIAPECWGDIEGLENLTEGVTR